MQRYAPDRIRNVALVGHQGSGKTTLAEALLHTAGAIPRRGRVEDGTTTTDHDPEERERGMSLSLSLAPFEWRGHKINLLDCPGEADCAGALHAALGVADLAVVVVSAVEGVEAQTEAAWELAHTYGVPRLVFVNKLDRERADFDAVIAQLRDRFGTGLALLELPIGQQDELTGVVDVLHESAELYDGDASAPQRDVPVPDTMQDREHEIHDAVLEEIVAGDDNLLERFLADDVPSVDELEHALTVEMEHEAEFPVLCGSAITGVGVDRLADYLVEIGPPASDRPATVLAGDTEVSVPVDPDADPLAVVFHTIADPYVGHLSLFRVLSGTVKPDDHLTNTRTGTDERLHGLFTLRGKEHLEVPALPAGDIGVVAKLTDTRTGDVLAPKGRPVRVPRRDLPPAVAAIALVPRTQSDEDKLGAALARLCEEDPTLQVERAETGQLLLRGLGDVQLGVALERLERRYGVQVDTEPAKVAFRETITTAAGAEGRHKKQTGGHGQFAVCVLEIEPLGRGEGFRFDNKVVGGAISKGYIPAVQKGVEEAMAEGGVRGFPVVDVAVTVVDGKEHPVDSSELAFKLAARAAFREAMAKAGPVVLEPVAAVTVDVPSDLLGDVLGDLNGRRARVAGTTPAGPGHQVIEAFVPEAELVRYPAELRSLTGGRGRCTIVHDHYDVVPANLVDRLTASSPALAGTGH